MNTHDLKVVLKKPTCSLQVGFFIFVPFGTKTIKYKILTKFDKNEPIFTYIIAFYLDLSIKQQ